MTPSAAGEEDARLSRSQRIACIPTDVAASISFTRIGNKQKLVWSIRKRSRDLLVAFPFGLGSHAGVEESGDVRRQVAWGRSAKQELLREDASGRVDADDFFLPPPSFECDGHIGKNFAVQFPANESLLPDSSLKRLQWRALAVARDQPLAVSGARTQPRFFRMVQPARRFKAVELIHPVLRV